MVVDLTPLATLLMQCLGIILLALASAAAAYITQHFRLKNGETVRATFQSAATNAAAYGLSQVAGAGAAGELSFQTKSAVVAAGAKYMNALIPATITSIKADAPAIEKVVEAQVSKLLLAQPAAAQAPAAPTAAAVATAVVDKLAETPGGLGSAIGAPLASGLAPKL